MPKLRDSGLGWLWPFGSRTKPKRRKTHASLIDQLRNTAVGSGVLLVIVVLALVSALNSVIR